MRLHICSIYPQRPIWCRDYPWDTFDDKFDDCQFVKLGTKELMSLEEVQKAKSNDDIRDYCLQCGKCCFYWEDGKPLVKCSALNIVDKK